MIAQQVIESQGNSIVIEAMSNISITLDRLMAVFAGLCVVTLLVVLWPVLMGLWPILIAALLHLAAVGWCFRRAWRCNWVREKIRVEGDRLIVEHFRAGRIDRSEWPAAWVKIQVERGHFSEPRLFLASQGRRLEVGSFLPVEERRQLARMLERALRPQSAWRSANPIQVS